MKKVLVTGANGFIGTSLMQLFSSKGYEVVGWDIVSSNNSDISVVQMSNLEAVKANLESEKPNIIIHCAGSADVGKSVKDPKHDFDGNVNLTHNLLFAMHQLNMNDTRVVFLSSAGVYGNPKTLPITEEDKLNPMSPYALHKVLCEKICEYFILNYGMDIKVARIFSAYGKGLKKQIFWDMSKKLSDTGCLSMFGTGNESRDYINIEDLINALYLIATESSEYWLFNVANGEETTIREATECFASCMGVSKDKISFNGEVREGDPLNWCADISRLKSLGYEKIVSLSEGLKTYCDWINEM